ncbi:MAG: ABC transporter substrate-binding protein [Chitinophagales bacterium]
MIYEHNNYIELTVRDPLNSSETLQTYFLYRNEADVRSVNGIKIKIPIEKIACLSTTHLGFLEALHLEDKLIAFSGTEYIYNTRIRELVKQKTIAEVGSEGALNTELLITLQPDIIMAYDIGNADYDHFKKMEELHLHPVLNNEYLELTPLGQAEWIKYVAVFFDKFDEANKIFDEIADEYNNVSVSTASLKTRPTVFTGLAFKGEWTIPGGKSFAANYLHDAGADYLWEEDRKTGNFPVSLEEVISKAKDADFWLHPGAAETKDEILSSDTRLEYFSALKKGNIYNNNNRVNENGGNDYWESGVVYPQLILKDLVKIFHPELMQDHQFVYYKKLN